MNAIAPNGSEVAVGGMFNYIGGAARDYVAVLDAVTAQATLWNARADNEVLVLAANGPTIYAGGYFRSIGDRAHSGIAAVEMVPTAITIAAITAEARGNRILLEWYVSNGHATSIDLYRRTQSSDWQLLGHPRPDPYEHIVVEDVDISPGTSYGYRLVVRDDRGGEETAEVWVAVPPEAGAPSVVRLDAVRPNPFESRANVAFGVPRAMRVRLQVFDVRGRLVTTLIDREIPAGWRVMEWNGTDESGRPVPSGTYFARIESGGTTEVRKFTILR